MSSFREQFSVLPVEATDANTSTSGRNTRKGFLVSRSGVVVGIVAFGTILFAVAIGVYQYTKQSVIGEKIKYVNSTSDKFSCLSSPAATPSPHNEVVNIKLPENLVPIYYKLELIPFIEPTYNFSLQGKVWIDVKCVQDTDQVTVHIKNLTIFNNSVWVWQVDEAELPISQQRMPNSDITVTGHVFDEIRDFYSVQVTPQLTSGRLYRIYIEYTGMLDDSLDGFYRSSYEDHETNETKYIGTTQFEPIDARKAFPCFDEPSLKAKFEVSLGRRVQMTSISNMDIRKTEPIQDMTGWEWDHYQKSIPMSTYLVAFVVSDFENRVSVRTLSKPVFRIWARKSAIQQVEYARDVGPRLLTFFENYFGIDYPLPKLDMIAIPDFAAGAMENMGLITFREISLLFDKAASSDHNKLVIAETISHELSHQWFGNLVTAKELLVWWTDLWLNEGFATYTEYVGVDHISPDWKILEQFVTEKMHEAFKLDALDSSHTVSAPIHHPNEINQQFDIISYHKGASLIRMINHVLTEDSYRKGLHNYLKKWSYKSANEEDLWIHLAEQAYSDGTLNRDISLIDVMNSWTRQIGYPVVTVQRNYHNGSVTFSQAKFRLNGNKTSKPNEFLQSYRWWVPISYATNTENSKFQKTKPHLWLTRNDTVVTTMITIPESNWVIVNIQQTSYYRVNYDPRNWQLITAQLFQNPKVIHTVNRAQLVDDAFQLARAGLLDYQLAFDISLYLQTESEYLPWHAYYQVIEYVSNMLSNTDAYGAFQQFVRHQVDKQYKSVGFFEGYSESYLAKQHRVDIVRLACSVDHPDCVATAQRLFSSWMNKSDPDTNYPVPTNLQRDVYCTVMKHGGQKEWDFLWERYSQCNVAGLQLSMLYAMGCSKDVWILNRYLDWASREGTGIRKQDGPSVFKSVSTHEVGDLIAFNFIREKWPIIMNYFGLENLELAKVIKYAVARLSDPIQLEEMERFQSQHRDQLDSVSRTAQQAIEEVRNNVQWKKNHFKIIRGWLNTHVTKLKSIGRQVE